MRQWTLYGTVPTSTNVVTTGR